MNSTSNVFRGTLGDGRKIAVELLEGKQRVKRVNHFADHAAAVGRIRHANVAHVLGWGTGCHREYWVYEYVDGADLETLLRGCYFAFRWPERLKASIGAATGLEHLHAQTPELLHNGVRLSSVVVSSAGCAKVAQLASSDQAMPCDVVAVEREGISAKSLGESFDGGDLRDFGQLLLALLIGKRFASHELFRKMPHAPGAKQQVARGLDPSAEWPEKVAEAFADVALGCLHPDEAYRPSFPDVVMFLRQIQENYEMEAEAMAGTQARQSRSIPVDGFPNILGSAHAARSGYLNEHNSPAHRAINGRAKVSNFWAADMKELAGEPVAHL